MSSAHLPVTCILSSMPKRLFVVPVISGFGATFLNNSFDMIVSRDWFPVQCRQEHRDSGNYLHHLSLLGACSTHDLRNFVSLVWVHWLKLTGIFSASAFWFSDNLLHFIKIILERMFHIMLERLPHLLPLRQFNLLHLDTNKYNSRLSVSGWNGIFEWFLMTYLFVYGLFPNISWLASIF